TASYIITAAATETFRLSTWPYIGIAASASHASRVDGRKPRPSPPSTSAIGGTSERPNNGSPSASAPTTRTPALLSQRSTLPRLGALSTGKVSAAPVATLRAAGVSFAARERGTTTASIAAASAVRRHAP